jgi:hypothetical protein
MLFAHSSLIFLEDKLFLEWVGLTYFLDLVAIKWVVVYHLRCCFGVCKTFVIFDFRFSQ